MAVFQGLNRIRWMILHATGGEAFESPQALAARIPGWPLYHWLVYADGQIIRCAGPATVLYHCDGHNVGTVSVAVVGEFPDDRMPPALQVEAVKDLFEYAQRGSTPRLTTLIGHSEVPGQTEHACPGPWWVEWAQAYRRHHVSETRIPRKRDAQEPIHRVTQEPVRRVV
jgi:N-acetylmuramoyl-L-alanine amidase